MIVYFSKFYMELGISLLNRIQLIEAFYSVLILYLVSRYNYELKG